jgi:hypothetical protein
VIPLLERAERYFLKPIDLIPEMTHGLPGLLDDAYLVIRTLQSLDRGSEPFLDWDLDAPVLFLTRLLGPSMTGQLDAIAAEALDDLSDRLDESLESHGPSGLTSRAHPGRGGRSKGRELSGARAP